jgi:hypothetical protein
VSSVNECVVTLEFIVLYDMNSPPRQAYDTVDNVGVDTALTYQRETVGHPLKADLKIPCRAPQRLTKIQHRHGSFVQ